MKQKEIEQLSATELKLKLQEKHEELMNFRLKKVAGQVQKTHLIKQNRQDIARLETALRAK